MTSACEQTDLTEQTLMLQWITRMFGKGYIAFRFGNKLLIIFTACFDVFGG